MCKIGISRSVALSFEHHKLNFMPLTFSKAFTDDPKYLSLDKELPNYPKFTTIDFGKENLIVGMKTNIEYLGV